MNPTIPEAGQPIQYLAHSPNDDGAGVPESLRDHLQAVANRTAGFATAFGADEQGYAAGLLHDLGKYADQFLRRLQVPGEPGRDHWSMGAALLAAIGEERGKSPQLPRPAITPGSAGCLSGVIRHHPHVGIDFLGKYIHLFTYASFLPDPGIEDDLTLVQRARADWD